MVKEGSLEFDILPGGSEKSKRVIPMLLNNVKSSMQSICSEISRAIPCQDNRKSVSCIILHFKQWTI